MPLDNACWRAASDEDDEDEGEDEDSDDAQQVLKVAPFFGKLPTPVQYVRQRPYRAQSNCRQGEACSSEAVLFNIQLRHRLQFYGGSSSQIVSPGARASNSAQETIRQSDASQREVWEGAGAPRAAGA